ncbi:9928_t:CDS:2 [Acaulospora morrowiae]|uniref:9928_t:CDS:1 n=1 Tax=Acaulospora morrowiae TaxID=94023 RepID=A0A9N9GAV3_9GLOM|nr:9928_t:CDS:2 [Acaulospora morrowiae]
MSKFFKIFEYLYFQRGLAEEYLIQALQSVSSENDKLSSKAQQWLHDFDIMTRSLNVERYWNSVQTNEEHETTRMMKANYSEREMNSSSKTPTTIELVYDGYKTSSSEESTDEAILIDLVKVEEAYSKIRSKMHVALESGRKVKEIIYEFSRDTTPTTPKM